MSTQLPHNRVLVVEDEADLRSLIRAFLGHDGFDVTEATSGHDALTLLAGGTEIDLIITDLEMPQMNGYEFLTELNNYSIATPIIVMSAHNNKRDLALKLGAKNYLTKPFGYKELSDIVKSTLQAQ
jgi:CheY-like chemotaxis protein